MMRKLVRDKIPALMVHDHIDCTPRILDGPALDLALRDKLLEETREVMSASPETLAEEMADVLEVLRALAEREFGYYGWSTVEQARCEKYAAKGGFHGGWEIEVP